MKNFIQKFTASVISILISFVATAEIKVAENTGSFQNFYSQNKAAFTPQHQEEIEEYIKEKGDLFHFSTSGRKIKDGSGREGTQVLADFMDESYSLFFYQKNGKLFVKVNDRAVEFDPALTFKENMTQIFLMSKKEAEKVGQLLATKFDFNKIKYDELNAEQKKEFVTAIQQLLISSEILLSKNGKAKKTTFFSQFIPDLYAGDDSLTLPLNSNPELDNKIQDLRMKKVLTPDEQVQLENLESLRNAQLAKFYKQQRNREENYKSLPVDTRSCIVGAHVMKKIEDQPCGYVQNADGTFSIPQELNSACKDKKQVQCNTKIFGENGVCVTPQTTGLIATTDTCRTLWLKGDPEWEKIFYSKGIRLEATADFINQAMETAERAFREANCSQVMGMPGISTVDRRNQEKSVKIRECLSLRDAIQTISHTDCIHDIQAEEVFRKLKEEGMAILAKSNTNGRMRPFQAKLKEFYDHYEDVEKTDAKGNPILDADKKPLTERKFVKAKYLFSNQPFCQSYYELRLKQEFQIDSIALGAVNEAQWVKPMEPLYPDAPMPRQKPRMPAPSESTAGTRLARTQPDLSSRTNQTYVRRSQENEDPDVFNPNCPENFHYATTRKGGACVPNQVIRRQQGKAN